MSTCVQPKCVRNSYPTQTSCSNKHDPFESFPLAMTYVPMQRFKNVYELDEALQVGTIFPELNKPFMAWKGGCHR